MAPRMRGQRAGGSLLPRRPFQSMHGDALHTPPTPPEPRARGSWASRMRDGGWPTTRILDFARSEPLLFALFAAASVAVVLPIWIGPGEAMAIQRLVSEQPFPRPLTHDLVALVIEGAASEPTWHASWPKLGANVPMRPWRWSFSRSSQENGRPAEGISTEPGSLA